MARTASMTEGRPYRAARTPQEAIEELRQSAGSQFDPQVVEALAACVDASGGCDCLVRPPGYV